MAGKRGRSGPPTNLNAVVHGGYALKGRLNGTRLNRRSALFKTPWARIQEYDIALGGDPSPQELALIHDTVLTSPKKSTQDMGKKPTVKARTRKTTY